MQSYDMLMLVVLVCATVFGFWKGVAWQIASLASLVVSYFAALRFSEQLAPTFGDSAPLNRFIAMAVIYAVTSFVIWTGFRLISGIIDKVRLEAFDKQLGAMFGFAKGVLLCVAITFFAVTLLPPTQGQMIVDSQSGRYIVALLNKTDSVVPPELHEVIDPYLQKVQERLNPGHQTNWPSTAQQPQQPSNGWPTGLPQVEWPQSIPKPQFSWPQQSGDSQQPQPLPSWPSQSQYQAPAERDPYSTPREPNPFPDPSYSAERTGNPSY